MIQGGVVGRADDITKIKGVLGDPSAIEEVVRSVKGLSSELRWSSRRKGTSTTLRSRSKFYPKRKVPRIDPHSGERSTPIENDPGLQLEVHPGNSLPRYEVKAKRFQDLRKHG